MPNNNVSIAFLLFVNFALHVSLSLGVAGERTDYRVESTR